MSAPVTLCRGTYINGGWGEQSVSVERDGDRWIVAAWDRWSHRSLRSALTHYGDILAANP